MIDVFFLLSFFTYVVEMGVGLGFFGIGAVVLGEIQNDLVPFTFLYFNHLGV